jgi:hypothetical protein
VLAEPAEDLQPMALTVQLRPQPEPGVADVLDLLVDDG